MMPDTSAPAYSGFAAALTAYSRRIALSVALPALIICFMISHADAAATPEQDPRILILNSYHRYYTWSDDEVDGIVETLRKTRPGIDPIVEYLDCKFNPGMEHFEQLSVLFKKKFSKLQVSLVIAVDDPALDFALKYRAKLFPGAPIVFCGINDFGPEMIAGQAKVTGVAQLLDIRGTVELMLKVHPGTREILVVHDYTSTGLATRSQAAKELRELAGGVAIRYLDNLSTGQMLRRIKELPPSSLVLALSYSRDREGAVFDLAKAAEMLGEQSPVPVYAVHEEHIGHGIIGGSLLGGREHGTKAAEMALEVLNGRDIATLPVYTGKTSRVMFDHKLLMRFNVPPERLPRGSMVINKPESFYGRYTSLVWTTIGTMTGLAIIIALLTINISQKRRSTLALSLKAKELEERNAELQEFSMIAYHDMQEPLRVIGGFVQLLEKRYQGQLDQEAVEYITITVQNVNLMKQLFSDLLNYLGLNRHRMSCARHDGNEILSGVLAGLRERIMACQAVVTFDHLPEICGDRNMLTLLVHNLLTNSLKFRGADAPVIHISSSLEHDQVIISVSDNGIGIASEYNDKIFKIFKKLHSRSEYPGTGIGLSICKRVVELHGGHIWFDSQEGIGSKFSFSLPAKCPEQPSSGL